MKQGNLLAPHQQATKSTLFIEFFWLVGLANTRKRCPLATAGFNNDRRPAVIIIEPSAIIVGMFALLVIFSIFSPADQSDINEWVKKFYE
ncbi:hypothetical protein [Cellvibrio mixtus]|uniref:hypothetical protein n=1 Tax=Cellvibrio mixtus TaxID=39650 RepID=UPI000587D426|nr:hypothetical protein [Cellvibrio mixtus]